MYTANTNFDYTRRQFAPLPAGFVATGEIDEAISGKIDEAANTYVKCGLFLTQTDILAGGVRLFKLPTVATTAATVAGMLYYDETNFRVPTQPAMTHTPEDLITIIRKGHVRVHAVGAIAVNASVFLVREAAAGEEPGMLKATSSANAIQLFNCKWAEIRTSTALAPATLEMLGGGFL
jgi:hypothetical protein